MNDSKTFPSGDARYRSRSASLWSEEYSANATSTDWKTQVYVRAKFPSYVQGKRISKYVYRGDQHTFLGILIRSAYLVRAVRKVQGGNGGGKELPLRGVPSSLSV